MPHPESYTEPHSKVAKYFSHPQALIDPGAKIGKNTRIWAFAHVMGKAEIGEDCNIGNYAFIESGAKLGNQVTVKNGVQVWEGVTAEDQVFLGPNCVFTNDKFPRSGIKREKSEWLLPTLLKRGASIGANVTVVCGVTIGEYALVAAGSVVTHDVPDHALVLGVPARFHCWICRCGKPLSLDPGQEVLQCLECQEKYQRINPTQIQYCKKS
jgi:UDP-2-acetamido-3-amino-2,3-dideoxy-glucuronate N-acetyltransferase